MVAGMRIREALLFAVLIKVAHCGQSDSRAKQSEDISQFYSDSANIRTLNTTLDKSDCKVDVVRKRSSHDVAFNRQYTSRTHRSSVEVVGKFMNTRRSMGSASFDAMDVEKNGRYSSHERLLHVFDHGNCGIFYVTDNWGRRGNDYELRVKNGNNGRGNCYNQLKSDTKRAGVFSRLKAC
uniref:Lipocalin n=1 Tax=Rhipicephalus appendiculatus TaxID=34631 RepID=A0A131YUJ5_RHIAP